MSKTMKHDRAHLPTGPAFAIFDRRMRLSAASPEWETTLRLSGTEIAGDGADGLPSALHAGFRDALAGRVVSVEGGGLAGAGDAPGVWHWVLVPLKDAHGAVNAVAVRADPAPRAAPPDAAVLPREAGGLSHDLTEREADLVGRLARTLAHEVNNHLAVILSNLEIAELRVAGGDARLRLGDAIAATEACARLTRKIALLGGEHHAPSARVVVDEAIAGFVEGLGRALGGRHEIVTDLEAGPAEAEIDAVTLETLLEEVAGLVASSAPQAGGLEIRTRRPASGVDIGIRALLPGDRSGSAERPMPGRRPPPGGFGLGGAAVALMVRRLGGALAWSEAPGEGVALTLSLPGPRPEAPRTAARDDGLIPGNGALVLVVCGDAPRRETIMRWLEVVGYAVIEADRAAAALELLHAGEPVDLVLAESDLPGGTSGEELVASLERHPGGATGLVIPAPAGPETEVDPLSRLSRAALSRAIAAALGPVSPHS